MIQYFLRLVCRQSPLKRSRWRSCIRLYSRMIFILITSFLLVGFFHSIFIFQTAPSETNPSDIIISLTTIPARFHYELPFTVHSLLSQTQLPKEIRIYLSLTMAIIRENNLTLTNLKLSLQKLDSSIIISKLFDRLVQIHLEVEDYGPATKYLPIIKEFHSSSQPILICDDDQYYHPYTLITLNQYSKQLPNSMVGLRGWRIREDLTWGVGGKYEMAEHIIESQYLAEIYRVGVLTANSAYFIRPSFFNDEIYLEFNSLPDDIRHVDDIWLNGQASIQNISRYVVPSCCSHISVTRTHVLENYLMKNQMNRFTANSHALFWFRTSWEKDLWYRFHGVNRPKYRNLFVMIYRMWIDFILQLKFSVYFG